MYIPKHFREEDPEKIRSFINAHPFGIILSSENDHIKGTHIPFLIEQTTAGFHLIGHLAAANDQLKQFRNKQNCLVIFNGPHAYVSPSLYAEDCKVPTWNFIAVHLYGRLKIIDDFESKFDILEKSIETFESGYQMKWKALDEQYRDKLIDGMTGLEVEVTSVEAKYKLSQNRSDETRENVTRHFEKEDPELGKYMREG